MRLTEKYYIAGLFDGEGWVSASRRTRHHRRVGISYVMTVGIVNTHEATIRYLHSHLGGTILRTHKERNKPLWRWQLQQGKARDFLKWIAPCLVIKQAQARLGIQLWGIVDSYKVQIKRISNTGRVLPEREVEARDSVIRQLRIVNGRAS